MRTTSFKLVLSTAVLIWAVSTVHAGCQDRTSPRMAVAFQNARTALDKNQTGKGLQILETFSQKHPKDRHYLLFSYLGHLSLQEGKTTQAFDAYRSALTLCQEKPELWQNYAQTAWSLSDYPATLEGLTKAYDLRPNDELLFHMALTHIHMDQPEKAVAILEPLISDPTRALSLQWLESYSSLCLDLERAEKARRALVLWEKRFKTEPRYWRTRSIVALHQKQYEQAAACLKIVATMQELPRQDQELLADLLLQLGVPLQAAVLYEEILAKSPKDNSLLEKLVSSYRMGMQPQKALDAINRGMASGTMDSLWQTKGEILFSLNDYASAMEAFNQAILKGQAEGRTFLYLAYCAVELDRTVAAQRALRKATEFADVKKEAARLMAWLENHRRAL